MRGGRNIYNESIMQTQLRNVKNFENGDLIAMFEAQVDLSMLDPDMGLAWFDVMIGYFFAITNSMERSRHLAAMVYYRMRD